MRRDPIMKCMYTVPHTTCEFYSFSLSQAVQDAEDSLERCKLHAEEARKKLQQVTHHCNKYINDDFI